MKKDIHTYFGLSYAQYLAIPRSVLQSMPLEWQYQFVELLKQLDMTDWHDMLPDNTCYKIELRNMKDTSTGWKWGTKATDPLANYDRGRRNVFE